MSSRKETMNNTNNNNNNNNNNVMEQHGVVVLGHDPDTEEDESFSPPSGTNNLNTHAALNTRSRQDQEKIMSLEYRLHESQTEVAQYRQHVEQLRDHNTYLRSNSATMTSEVERLTGLLKDSVDARLHSCELIQHLTTLLGGQTHVDASLGSHNSAAVVAPTPSVFHQQQQQGYCGSGSSPTNVGISRSATPNDPYTEMANLFNRTSVDGPDWSHSRDEEMNDDDEGIVINNTIHSNRTINHGGNKHANISGSLGGIGSENNNSNNNNNNNSMNNNDNNHDNDNIFRLDNSATDNNNDTQRRSLKRDHNFSSLDVLDDGDVSSSILSWQC